VVSLLSWEEHALAHLVHRVERGHSAKDFQRRVADFSRSAVFAWFSSHSASNGRGSVMAYTACPQGIGAWCAGLRYDAGWRLGQVKGISRPEVESFLAGPRRVADA
jgi:hypothetical protein